MKKSDPISRPGALALRWAFAPLLLVATALPLAAHSGMSLQAPLKATAPVIDGTIEQPLWGPERTGAPATGCGFLRLFALRTSTKYYVAVDVPELVADPTDTLLLFFDGDHNGGGAPDAADRAIQLLGFPAGTNQAPTTAQIFSGTGAGWGAAAPFSTVKSSRTGTAGAARLTVEVEVPISSAPVGFALFYGSGDFPPQDCDGDSIAEPSFKWPPALPNPSGAAPGLTDPSQWGDLGRRAPLVAFAPPTCCHSADITFTPNVQPFTAGVPVDITARVHNNDSAFQAKNVQVQIRVHKFGTGGGVLFTTSPTDPVIPTIGTLTTASTSPVTWPSPPAATHGCIRAEIQPPTEGATTALDDYSLGINALAQYNIDVACVPKGQKKQLIFNGFNPHKGKEQKIIFMKRERFPARLKGLAIEVAQPDRLIRPLEDFDAGLVVAAPAELQGTDLPRQKIRVLAAAGGTVGKLAEGEAAVGAVTRALPPVRVAAKPGERLHIMAMGEVDIDGKGPLAPVGPEGRDVSKETREGQFLLAGKAGSRFGGALLGSFDGFKTGFLVGPEATVTVPSRAKGFWLAVNDLVRQHADNTGKGFDVQVWALPAAAGKATGRFAEVDVFATTMEEVRIGRGRYAVVTILGGVTYQILVPPPSGK